MFKIINNKIKNMSTDQNRKRILKDFCRKKSASLTVKLPSELQKIFREELNGMTIIDLPPFGRLIDQQLREIEIWDQSPVNKWTSISRLENTDLGYAFRPHSNARKVMKEAYNHLLDVFERPGNTWLFKMVPGDGSCLVHSVNDLLGTTYEKKDLMKLAKGYMRENPFDRATKKAIGWSKMTKEMKKSLRPSYDMVYELKHQPNNLGEKWLSLFANDANCRFVVFSLETTGKGPARYGCRTVEPESHELREEKTAIPTYYIFISGGHYYPMVPPLPVRPTVDMKWISYSSRFPRPHKMIDEFYKTGVLELPSGDIMEEGYVDQTKELMEEPLNSLLSKFERPCTAWKDDKKNLKKVGIVADYHDLHETSSFEHEEDDCDDIEIFTSQADIERCCQNEGNVLPYSQEPLKITDDMREEGLSEDMIIPLQFEIYDQLITNCYNIVYLRSNLQSLAKEGKELAVPVTIDDAFMKKYFDPEQIATMTGGTAGEVDRLMRPLSKEQLQTLESAWNALIAKKPGVMKKYTEVQDPNWAKDMTWNLGIPVSKNESPYVSIVSVSSPFMEPYVAFHIIEEKELEALRGRIRNDLREFDREEVDASLKEFDDGIHDELQDFPRRAVVKGWRRLISASKWSIIFPSGPRVQSGVSHGRVEDGSFSIESISADHNPYQLISMLAKKMETGKLVVELSSGLWALNLYFKPPEKKEDVRLEQLRVLAKNNPGNAGLQERVKNYKSPPAPPNLTDLVKDANLSQGVTEPPSLLAPATVKMMCLGWNPIDKGNILFPANIWGNLWEMAPKRIQDIFQEFNQALWNPALPEQVAIRMETQGFRSPEEGESNSWYTRLQEALEETKGEIEQDDDLDPVVVERYGAFYALYSLLAEAIVDVGDIEGTDHLKM
jgi:hypothetical protein